MDGVVPFKELANWIETQAKIMSRESFVRPVTNRQPQKPAQQTAAHSSTSHEAISQPTKKRASQNRAPRTPWKGPFVCIFCQEEGRSNVAHYTAECYINKLPMDKKWDVLARHKACLNCLDLGHEAHSCPEKARMFSMCQITHGTLLSCKPEPQVYRKEIEI